MLSGEVIDQAHLALANCELFMSLGTSAVVEPAATFVHIARRAGAATVEINLEPTPISGIVDHALAGRTGEILPRIVDLTR